MTEHKTQHDSETPAYGQQVIVACAFIHHNFDGVEKVFLAQRAMTKKFFPGVFEVPGGHVDFGEEIVTGLKREVQEELGKDIAVGDPFNVFTYVNNVKGAHAVEVAYFAEFVGGLEVELNPEDHMAGKWFSIDQFDEFRVNRADDDEELKLIRRGFELLAGKTLHFS
jgi:ADP-ribose pyrophosphatase YjhB (NUDIX family)